MSYYIDVQKLIDEEKRQAVKKVLLLLFNEQSRTHKLASLSETSRYKLTETAEITPTYVLFNEEIDDVARKYNLRFDEGIVKEEV